MRRQTLLSLLFACLSLPALSQSDPPEKLAPPKPRSATAPSVKKKSTAAASAEKTLKSGKLVSLDIDKEEAKIQEATGAKTYVLTERTRFLKKRLEASPEDFKPGMSVTLKLRKVRGKEDYTVFEFCDNETYDWLAKVRKEPTTGKIKELTDETLTLAVGSDEVIYSHSDKTEWEKEGKTASQKDFKSGETVTVAPRSLPSGTIMAKIVADHLPEKEVKKRTSSGRTPRSGKSVKTLRGQITQLELQNRRFYLQFTGNSATIYVTAATEVRIRTKPASLSALRIGQQVSVRISTAEDGTITATRITIETTVRYPKTKIYIPAQGLRPRLLTVPPK